MKVLESEDDLDREEESDVVGKAAFPSEEGEELSSAGVVEQHEDVRWRLECALQVDNVRMVDPFKNTLLALDVLDLFESNNLYLLQTFESKR